MGNWLTDTLGSPVWPLTVELPKRAQTAQPVIPTTTAPTRPEPDGRAQQRLAPRAGAPLVSLSDRFTLLGWTGTGKTVAAKRLLVRLRALWPHVSVYVLDTKGDDDFAGWSGRIESADVPKPVGKGKTQVWAPPDDDRDAFGQWFGRILAAHDRTKPAAVLVDELSTIGGRTGQSFPVEFMRLQKLGRGKAVCCITLTQEAAYIPRQVLGQTTHLLRFGLVDQNDAVRADRLVHGTTERREPRETHGFWYRAFNSPDEPVEYASIGDFL